MAEAIPLRRTIAPLPPRGMGMEAAISHDAATQRLAAGLRLFVGRGKLFSVEMVAEATGISGSAIEKYLAGDATPGMAALLRILAVLPEAFANHLLDLAGLTGAYRVGDAPVSEASALTDKLTAAQALAKALEDGRIDHQERAALTPQIRALGSRLLELAAQWERNGN